MSDSSSTPNKRRRTKGAFEMKVKQVQMTWPPKELPVEIFQLIVEYLPRSSVQNMRRVNKEFEEKVSAYLFKVVVVPFKPEIYGITPEPTLAGITHAQTRQNEILQGSVMLQDKGMRVFQGFGGHIRKFAMSFEFDERKLANPPTKSDQEAIKAFWGIYRWPFKAYNRYAQLEGLEQTADETRTMAKALRFIVNANELGLSIDGGLGWLAGPDINQRVIDRGGKVPVFGESKFVPEDPPKITKAQSKIASTSSPSSSPGEGHQRTIFRRMLQESGHQGQALEAALQMLQEGEHITDFNPPHDPLASTVSSASSSFRANSLSAVATPTPAHAPTPVFVTPNGLHFAPTTLFAGSYYNVAGDAREVINLDPDSESDDMDGETATEAQAITTAAKSSKTKSEGCPLKPNELTTPQREMLLEIEWAQRAFMQSYAIAIIDNPMTFNFIETLTIARIPNRHLPILRREDFWDGLPQLKKFSLAVIPDWRDIVKLPTSWVQDIKLAPSQSVNGVFQILQDQISRRKNIKTLHFEWIGGGEEAAGLFARNQQVLAAPLVPKALDMVNRSYVAHLLALPHVEHLSLKNCWVSPHILTRLALAMKKEALQSFTFDSVSLTAPVALNAQPGPLTHAGHNNAHHAAVNILLLNLQPLAGGHNGPAPIPVPAVPTNANGGPAWLSPPRVGSWSSFIDTFTPGNTIAQIRYARNQDVYEPEPRDPSSINTLEFKSCGYVHLPLDFDQTILDPSAPPPPQAQAITKHISEIDAHMMKPHDYTMGTIVNHICNREKQTLENAFQMDVGWGPSRSVLYADSVADGIVHPGQGRFDGLIWQPRLTVPGSDPSSSSSS
ncbi:hypothetical protein D0Z07_6214 [Hyphodiscus hymeniophilus]|uniref:F-box domain-containing protein n=1 Tax=Hyphodiscus hymeniophilus TaxID=353542 RepID=A0A9P6VF13_9HELO|nr:hypothetical protein D0Z07_6214 [Hyphodiscus hymeniophilus]